MRWLGWLTAIFAALLVVGWLFLLFAPEDYEDFDPWDWRKRGD